MICKSLANDYMYEGLSIRYETQCNMKSRVFLLFDKYNYIYIYIYIYIYAHEIKVIDNPTSA